MIFRRTITGNTSKMDQDSKGDVVGVSSPRHDQIKHYFPTTMRGHSARTQRRRDSQKFIEEERAGPKRTMQSVTVLLLLLGLQSHVLLRIRRKRKEAGEEEQQNQVTVMVVLVWNPQAVTIPPLGEPRHLLFGLVTS